MQLQQQQQQQKRKKKRKKKKEAKRTEKRLDRTERNGLALRFSHFPNHQTCTLASILFFFFHVLSFFRLVKNSSLPRSIFPGVQRDQPNPLIMCANSRGTKRKTKLPPRQRREKVPLFRKPFRPPFPSATRWMDRATFGRRTKQRTKLISSDIRD